MPAYGVHDGARVVVCSEELAQMFGAASAAEVLGRDVLSFVSAEARDEAIAAILVGGTATSYVSVGVRVEGETFPMRVESRPIRSGSSGEARLVLVSDLSPVALVVDDELPVARLTGVLMRHAGYQAVTCTSARQALAEYQPGAASVLVTDVRMPELDGVSLARRLRKLDPTLPIVFMSGYAEMEVPQDEGMVLLKKPFGIAELQRALAGLPARARARCE
jgi:CheY-like chemotaxis protein